MKHKLDANKQLEEAINYIKESMKYIYTIIGLFLISGYIGYIYRENLTFLNDILRELLDITLNLNGTEMIFFILQNNLQSALLSIILGSFLGIFPIFTTLTNGLILGYVLGTATDIAGFGIWWRLVPHGIFELPAIFISFGLGTKLGFAFFEKEGVKVFKNRLYQSANVFLMIIIPLLIIAAAIEGLLISLW